MAGEPAWFVSALAEAPERTFIDVEGAAIETLTWGTVGQPAVLLLHGLRAHADWWSYIAPILAEGRRVVAFSWSGMGRSDWRASYSIDMYVRETLRVAEATGVFDGPDKPYLIGHSFGGAVALSCAAAFGERFKGVVVIDSHLRASDDLQEYDQKPIFRSPRPNRVYPTRNAAIARFKLSPDQPCGYPHLLRHIADRSLRPALLDDGGSGWTWCFDPHLFARLDWRGPAEAISEARCPLAFIYGQHSKVMTPDILDFVRERLSAPAPMIEIADAEHHLIIDQPLAFIAAARALLETPTAWKTA